MNALKQFLDPREEPILHGLVALGVLLYGDRVGIPVTPEVAIGLQGYIASMAGMLLRANMDSHATVARRNAPAADGKREAKG